MKKILIGIVLAGTFFGFAKADEVDDAVTKAVAYLKTQGNDVTKTMALAAAGETVDVSYLKSFSGTTAIEYVKPIMAIVAAGENPSTYPAQDFVAKLKSFASGTQLGSTSQVNDDIWGILALRSAGVQSSDSMIQNSKAFILSNQNADGGWAWNVGGTSDTNDTAVTIMALLEIGTAKSDSSIQKAIAYLKNAQNTDGGFPYDPVSPFGTGSDGNSDAWVIMAISKLGEDPKSWKKNENNPVAHLLSLQDSDGGFWWMQPPAEFNNKGATADAVIALEGKSFPVSSSIGGGSSGDSTVFYRIVGSSGEICRGGVKAATAMEVVVNAASACNYTYEIKDFSFGKFLSRINNDAAEGLKGWLYRVDGVKPNVGAADFALAGGEDVLWYYGESDDDPPVLGDVSDSVDLAVEIVGSDGSDGGGTSEIAFTVTPSLINFGKLVPGSSAMGQVTLKNEGQKSLNIQAEIAGNAVFNFLKIENVLWNLFQTFLGMGSQKNVGMQLSLPSGFNSFGQKQGTLIFWGTAE